ncbi:MAG TPA: ABC-F family ATP-binding cassette domain-containing protein [Gaiellaceae bacterium]
MAVVTATGLRKELSGDPLFDDVSFKVERRDRVSLSGPNGAGKTTLLRILNGETELHGGKLSIAKGTRIALHDQRPPAESHASLRDYVLSGAADLSAAEHELRRLERAMAAGDHEAATLRRYAESQARLEHAGGYAWRERLDSVTRNLGFSSADLERPLATFSGGELTRASLARALGGDPDLLLLDEPTNHLDVANLEWLERELQSIDAAVILVAHDRWFLEAVTTAVLELEAGRSTYFAGPWHNWRREKAARLSAAGTAAKRYDVDIARLERFVERFRYKKSLAKRAQAKLTQIGRLEQERAQVKGEISLLTRRAKSLGFEFLQPKRSGRTVVEVTDAALAAGDKALLSGVSFAVERGEHVALVGPNGSGKTTLLETLLGRREPAAGRLRFGHGVEPAYFSQHEIELDETRSVLACTQNETGLRRPEAQNLLGRFLFSGWEMHERSVSALSGGERRRLALALVVASGANLLLLDEPTNHLDLESREALEAALDAFPGTVLLVSHDRALLDGIADRTLAIEDGTIRSYEGGWAEYVAKRDGREEAAQPAPAKPKKSRPRAPKAMGPTELELLEAEIAGREAEIVELEGRLADDWANVDVVSAHRRARDELQALLSRWEQLFERSQA